MAGLSFDLIALQLFAGLALGAIYVLFAIGLSLIFGMLTVVNFAHGAFYMVGAYVGVYILTLGGNFWICLIAVPLAVGLFGLAVERILIRPLYGRGIDYPLLLTFGLSYVMVELVRIAFGKTGFPFDTPEVLQGAVNIGVGYFPLYRLFVIGATAAVLLAPVYGPQIRAHAASNGDDLDKDIRPVTEAPARGPDWPRSSCPSSRRARRSCPGRSTRSSPRS